MIVLLYISLYNENKLISLDRSLLHQLCMEAHHTTLTFTSHATTSSSQATASSHKRKPSLFVLQGLDTFKYYWLTPASQSLAMLAKKFTYRRAGQWRIHCLIACCNLSIKDAHGIGKVHRSQLWLWGKQKLIVISLLCNYSWATVYWFLKVRGLVIQVIVFNAYLCSTRSIFQESWSLHWCVHSPFHRITQGLVTCTR